MSSLPITIDIQTVLHKYLGINFFGSTGVSEPDFFRPIFVAAIPYSSSPRPRKDRDKTATDRLWRNDVTAIWRRTVSRAGRRATTKVLM